jgi:hypothetical protein
LDLETTQRIVRIEIEWVKSNPLSRKRERDMLLDMKKENFKEKGKNK